MANHQDEGGLIGQPILTLLDEGREYAETWAEASESGVE